MFKYKQSPTTTVHLVDTPGFDDSNRSDKEVLAEISLWLAQTFQRHVQLNGIIYLHRISDNRMGNSAKRNLKMFQKLCGDDALKKVILATTMWDNIPEHEGAQRVSELIQTPKFWGAMCDKGSQVLRHYDTPKSARDIIKVFIDARADPRMALDIQRELVIDQKTLDQTTAGKEVVSVLAEERKKLKAEIEELKQEWTDAMAARDQKAADDARREQIETERKFQQLERDRVELRASLEQLEAQKRLLEDQNRQHGEQMRALQENMQTIMTQRDGEWYGSSAASYIQPGFDIYGAGQLAEPLSARPAQLRHSLRIPGFNPCLSRDFAKVAYIPEEYSGGYKNNRLEIKDVQTGQVSGKIDLDRFAYSATIIYSHDGSRGAVFSQCYLIDGGIEFQVKIWDSSRFRELEAFKFEGYECCPQPRQPWSEDATRIAHFSFLKSKNSRFLQIRIMHVKAGFSPSEYKVSTDPYGLEWYNRWDKPPEMSYDLTRFGGTWLQKSGYQYLNSYSYRIYDLIKESFTFTTEEFTEGIYEGALTAGALYTSASWSPGLARLAVSIKTSGKAMIKIYETSSGRCTAEIPATPETDPDRHGRRDRLIWSPDSTRLAIDYLGLGLVVVWDVVYKKELLKWDKVEDNFRHLPWSTDRAEACTWSPNSRLLAVQTSRETECCRQIWDVAARRMVYRVDKYQNYGISDILWSLGSKQVAISYRDVGTDNKNHEYKFWDL